MRRIHVQIFSYCAYQKIEIDFLYVNCTLWKICMKCKFIFSGKNMKNARYLLSDIIVFTNFRCHSYAIKSVFE